MTLIPPTVPIPATNSFKAIVRSLMPFVYSGAAAIIAHFGYHVNNATVVQIVAIAGAALTIVLHALETQFPWVGILLGYIGAPVYPPSPKVTLAMENQMLKSQIALIELQLASLSSPPATP